MIFSLKDKTQASRPAERAILGLCKNMYKFWKVSPTYVFFELRVRDLENCLFLSTLILIWT